MEQPKKIDGHIESDDDDFPLMGKDWAKTDKSVKNEGFRMGLEASQEQSLQKGFNSAFKEALQMALAGGRLQGGIYANLSCIPDGLQTSGFTMPVLKPLSASNDNAEIPTHGPLQQLLASNVELISSIPTLLNSDLLKNSLPKPNQDIQTGSSGDSLGKGKSAKSGTVSAVDQDQGCMAVGDQKGMKNSGESQTQDQKGISSCVDVCNNKSHFWNQLESFKVQAETLGVVSANE